MLSYIIQLVSLELPNCRTVDNSIPYDGTVYSSVSHFYINYSNIPVEQLERRSNTCDQMTRKTTRKMINELKQKGQYHSKYYKDLMLRTQEHYGFKGKTFDTFEFGVKGIYIDLSIIMVTRNDGYGGNSNMRLANSLRQLFLYTWSINVELIIVEWDPVTPYIFSDKDISKVISLNNNIDMKVIQVPKRYATIPNYPNKTCNMFEYWGKNVGMRRAKGDWILITNIDDIFPKSLLDFMDMSIKTNRLDVNGFYLCSRHQYIGDVLNITSLLSLDDTCRHTSRNISNRCRIKQSNKDISYPGDFELFRRKHLDLSGGFLELFTNFGIDSEFLFRNIYHNNLTGYHILGCPYCHQKHTKKKIYGN